MTERIETLIIGGGQAGLSVGYHLAVLGRPFLIVDANQRTGDSWRRRWDSLRLFTPNQFNGLPGMPFPGPNWGFATKDEMGDYLEEYARHFDLPIRRGTKVDRLYREGGRFVALMGDDRVEADNVVVAMANWQHPKRPSFADEMAPDIVQMHVDHYRNPGQLQPGGVLVVGAGNSGAEIAMELAPTHRVLLSGPSTGQIPFRPSSLAGRILMPFVGKVILHRLLTTNTPMGRKVRAKRIDHGEPLLRVKAKDLERAGVERVEKVAGVRDGRPKLEDGRVLDVSNVVWCTGFQPGFSWIDLPVFEQGQVVHDRGVAASVPGLYFVGLKFLFAVSSSSLSGVGRDAKYVVDAIASNEKQTIPAAI